VSPSPEAQGGKAEPPARSMAAIYAAVILVEVVTLAALWWFQSAFSRG
jgi:hypothetical protein